MLFLEVTRSYADGDNPILSSITSDYAFGLIGSNDNQTAKESSSVLTTCQVARVLLCSVRLRLAWRRQSPAWRVSGDSR